MRFSIASAFFHMRCLAPSIIRYHLYVRHLIGIDEAGRGALAGPVSVGAVLLPADLNWRELYATLKNRGAVRLRDSKQLSAQQREVLFEQIVTHGRMKHAHAFVDAKVIDEIGIVNAASEAAPSITALAR